MSHHSSWYTASRAGLTRRTVLRLCGGAVAGMALTSKAGAVVHGSPAAWPPADDFDGELAHQWFDLARELVGGTPGYTPPVAARAYAYLGIALYEAIVTGIRAIEARPARLSA